MPSASDSSRCGEGQVTLQVSGTTGLYYWYDAPVNGTFIGQSYGSSFQTPALTATDTFYVAEYDTATTQDALSFDGTDDYVAIENQSYSSGGHTQLTVEAWIKTSDGSDQFIVSYDRNEYWRLEINGIGAGTGQIGFDVMTNDGQLDFGGSTRVDDGNWHHVAAVFDSGSVSIYIDGTLDATTTKGTSFGSGTTRYGFLGDGSESTSFDDARNSTKYSPGFFNGQMDELRIWHEARTQTEIQANMANCLNGRENGLVSYFRMDGSGTDDTVSDQTSNANNGVLRNMTLPGAWISSNLNIYGCPTCESARDTVIATINAIPSPDLGDDVCSSSSVTLDAGASYASYKWNTGETSQTKSADTSGIYSVEVDSAGTPCKGTDQTNVSILQQPTATDTSHCGPGSLPLTATGSTGNYYWYNSPNGDSLIGIDSSFTTPFLEKTDTFYVAAYGTDATDEAMSFDGTDDYVALNKSYSTADQIKSLTLEAWVKTTESGDDWNSNWSIIDFDRSEYFNLYITGDDGRVGFSTTDTDNNTDDFYSSTTVNDGSWHHIAAVYDGTDKIIYIDGVQDATKSNAHSGKKIGTSETRYGFIGDGSEASSFNGSRNNIHFNGQLDEVRIWHDTRNLQDIQNNKDICLSGSENSLEAYYKMEDGTGSSTLTDHSSNNFPGTLQNMDVNAAWINSGQPIDCSCGESARESVVVAIDPQPTNMLGTDICASSSVTLDAGPGYNSYKWNNGDTTQSILADTSGFYSVEVDSAGTPCTGSDGITVNILAEPSTSDTSHCGPGRFNLNASGSTGNYHWYDTPVSDSLIGAGSTFKTPLINESDTFYVAAYGQNKTDEAMSFDGTDDYVALDMYYTPFDKVTSFTLEAWVKTSVSGLGIDDNWSIIDFDRSEYFNMYITGDDGRVGFSTTDSDGNTDDFYSSTTVNDGNWHHIVAVYDGTDKTIYIDGVQDATKSNPHSGKKIGTSETRYGFIGDGSEASSFNGSRNNVHFKGQLDEVRIWHDARNLQEIQNNKDICLSGTESNLEAYYKMEDGAGSSTLTDHSMNNSTGTLQNMDVNTAWTNTGQSIDCSCGESSRDTVEVEINAVPSVDLGGDTCVSSSITLDAGTGYSSYEWKDGATTQTINATTSQAYWVKVDSNGTTCTGSDSINVNVGIASAPTTNGDTTCTSETVNLTASGTGTIQWWDQASGGNLLGVGDTLTIDTLSSAQTYYASTTTASYDALSFNGGSDYAANKNYTYNGSNYTSVTVEAWVKTSDGANQIISSYDRSEYWRLEVNGEGADNGRIGFDIMTDAGQLDFGSTTRVDDGNWHHVAAVYDNGSVSIYIDGNLDTSTTKGSSFGTGQTRYGFIGTGSEASSFDGSAAPSWNFNGTIDEVRIWNKARTQSQIQNSMDSCLQGNENGLAIYYRMSEGAGQVASDFSSSNDAEIKGASWVETDKAFKCSTCGESGRVSVNAEVTSGIDSVSYEVSYPGEHGSLAFIKGHGGSGKYDCQETSGIFNYDATYDTGTIKETLPNGGTFNIEVKDENGCKDTVSNITTSPSPSVTGIPANDASSSSRRIPAKDEWYYVTSSSNKAIVAINPQNNDLGTVDATVYNDPSATVYDDQAFMQRHFVIHPEHQPSSNVNVRLYFTNAELMNLGNKISNTPSLPDVTPPAKSDLGITKYQGPTEDSVYNTDDATSLKSIPQTNNATQFGTNYIEFTTSGFSEVWMNDDGGSPQPIELMHFDAQRKENQVVLKWATQTEVNNDYFTIEKSADGENFEEVTTVEGAGNSSTTLRYEAIDKNALEGLSYYRLKQTDFNGQYSYSDIVMVKNTSTDKQKMRMDVYPNPTRGQFNLNISGLSRQESVNITLQSVRGKTYFNKKIKVRGEGPAKLSNNPTQDLPPGIYFVTCTTSDKQLTKRLIIE